MVPFHNKLWTRCGLFLVIFLVMTVSAVSQEGEFSKFETGLDIDRLQACQEGAWSTEIDIVLPATADVVTVRVVPSRRGGYTIQPVDPDSPIYVSDGDLLSITEEVVCAIYAELLASQYEGAIMPFDLGLDAVHILDFDYGVVAFSTELDDPYGRFSDGAVLFSVGGQIPNRALMYAFETAQLPNPWELLGTPPYNLGLDAVHFVGEPEAFYDIIEAAREDAFSRDPALLQRMLESNELDILFSIEGTILFEPGTTEYAIFDGDILSARDGVVFTTIDVLHPPVGHTTNVRGVGGGYDSGLDALSGYPEEDAALFSTEVQLDGDILEVSQPPGTVAATYIPYTDLISNLFQGDDAVGLDALWHPY